MILKEKSENLLKTSPIIVNTEEQLSRTEVSYVNLSEKFKIGPKDYNRQYAHIYTVRLNLLKPRLLKAAKKKWENVKISSLADLADEQRGETIVTGTLYKHQPLKPSVLKEISEEHQLVPQPPATHFTSPEDLLVLEDETQRVRLVGNLPLKSLATGIVIAVKGWELDDGRFQVEDFCFPGVEMVPSATAPPYDDCYLALVSGLELSTNSDLLSLQRLSDWLCGLQGGSRDQQQAARVAGVVLAGGLVGVDKDAADTEAEAALVEGTKLLDQFCVQLARSIPIIVLPGDTDPSNHSLPQQPLHPCLLSLATSMRSCRMATNPHHCLVGGRRVIGHAGQPIRDLTRVTDDLDPLELLKSTLEWGHLAPTAPDTLDCYPFYESDPFILEEMPDIYFAGNQPKFQTDLYTYDAGDRSCRLVCIPTFSSSRTVVLVNLRTLQCSPVTLSHGLDSDS